MSYIVCVGKETFFVIGVRMNLQGNLKGIIKEIYEKQVSADNWAGSTYSLLNLLKNDYSGKVGELFLQAMAKELNLPCEYDEDKNSTDGTYDIVINSMKIEVKTAREGAHEKGEGYGNHQHESLRKDDDCHHYAFVDVGPNIIHLTILHKNEMEWDKKHEILKITPHLRRSTTDQYKFDFSQAVLKRAVSAGLCLQIKKETSKQELVSFLTSRGII